MGETGSQVFGVSGMTAAWECTIILKKVFEKVKLCDDIEWNKAVFLI